MPPLVQRIGLRISRALRARLDHAAQQGARSLSAEVTRRLKASFSSDGQQSLDLGELPLAEELSRSARLFADAYGVAMVMGLDEAQARHFATEKVRRVTGIDWSREIGVATAGGTHDKH